MDLSRIVSSINGDFEQKSYVSPCIYRPAEGFTLECCNGGWPQCPVHQVMGKLDDMYIRLHTKSQCDGETDCTIGNPSRFLPVKRRNRETVILVIGEV